MFPEDDAGALRSAALRTVQSILQARVRAERALLETKEALEEETRILELLNRTGAALASTLDLRSVAETVTSAATQLTGASFGVFLSSSPSAEHGLVTLLAVSGAPWNAFADVVDPARNALFGPTLRGEFVTRVADLRRDPRYGVAAAAELSTVDIEPRSFLAVPIISRSGQVMAGLFLGHPEVAIFTERAERLVVALAAQTAISMDNARLYEDARHAAAERARLLEAERAARAEVERVSLMKDEFLATLSHELRTPMNAVLGWSELLLARTPEDGEGRRALESIARNARAQARLIEDLLDMSRIVSGKIRLDVQELDLIPIVDTALESVRPSVEAKGITLHRLIEADAGLVFGDGNRLQQVIWNLLNNAVKFTPRGGSVRLSLRRVNSLIELRVQDSGVGIPSDFLPHVFERFRQADASPSRQYGGLGLGLSIVKQLVELHGGTVHAESDGQGCGATFVVTLPIRAVRDAAVSSRPVASVDPASNPPVDVSLSGLRVLVVDDDADARELVRSVLTEASADVMTASSCLEGIRLVTSERPDVIVSDIGMPEHDGYELIRAVRRLPSEQGGDTPAVALTAFARAEDRARAASAGYQFHAPKPIRAAELIAAVKRVASAEGACAP